MREIEKKRIAFAFALMIYMLIGIASACDYSLPQPLKQGLSGDLPQVCTYGNCSYINITTLRFPNQTEMSVNWNMTTSNGINYKYSLNGNYLQQIGSYGYTTCGDPSGVKQCPSVCFEVTLNGRDSPTGNVIIFFSLLFIIIMGAMLFFMVRTVLYLVEFGTEKENKPIYDISEFIYNWSAYLVLIVVFRLSVYYLGNPVINKVLGIVVFIAVWTNLGMPILAFLLSFGAVGWSGIIRNIKGGNPYEK